MWVYRVKSGRNPNQVPLKIAGRFEPFIAGRSLPTRDSVACIFRPIPRDGSRDRAESSSAVEGNRQTREDACQHASGSQSRVALVDGSASSAERGKLPTHPQIPVDTISTARFTTPTPREEWLLRGQLTTANLPNDERLALAGLVDVGTLNSLAGTSEATREFIGEFSRRLAELVPPSDVRAALWSAMLAGVSEIELRDEIRSSAPGLRAVVENALAERAWTAPRSTDLRLQLATVPMLLLPTYCRRSKATLIHCSVSRVVRSVSSSDAVEGVPETETPAPPVVVDAPEQVSSGPPIAPGVEPIPGTFTTMVWTPPGSDAA